MKQAEVETQKKLIASEVEAKKLFLDQEKSLKEAAEKLLLKEKQLKDSEAEKKRLFVENDQLQ
jgi:hypothetical protein